MHKEGEERKPESLAEGFIQMGEKIVKIKNRAWRRNWKNRAQIEGKSSKKWFTTKTTACRRKRG